MIHKMKLQNKPFQMIKLGIKTIEMRLYDEKRKNILVGDGIQFTNIDTEEQILVEVLSLNIFNDFEEVYNNYRKEELGYKREETANYLDMEKYYNEEEIRKYGVVAIEIKLLDKEENDERI